MAGNNDLAKMVPGFEFLQTLMKTAGAALPGIPGLPSVPGMGQWIVPTLDPDELEKRIQELKTVQFWLDQNAKLLGTTIQALEVQRMTLSTLKTMNLPMADLREALKIRPFAPAPAASSAPAPAAASPEAAAAPAPSVPSDPAPAKAAAAPAIDPMQWWGALTQQFTEIATQAVKDSAAEAAKRHASAQAHAHAPVSAAAKPPADAPAHVQKPVARPPAHAAKRPAVPGRKPSA